MRAITILSAALFLCASAFAQAGSSTAQASRSAAQASEALPHDRHDGMTVSADPYIDAERSKRKFGKADPLPAGLLPVEVFLRNETQQPIHINLSTVKLAVHGRDGGDQDIDRLAVEEVAVAIAHPNGSATPKAPRFPLGLGLGQDKKADKLKEILQPLSLDADIVPPMATIHGFLFFDLNHQMALASNASLYIPDASKIPSDQALMFFEVPLSGTQR